MPDIPVGVPLRHLLHPVGRQRVDKTGDDGQACHDTDRLAHGGCIGEIGAHRDRSQEKGRSAPFRRSDTGDLTQEVQPSSDPRDGRHPGLGCGSRDGIIAADRVSPYSLDYIIDSSLTGRRR